VSIPKRCEGSLNCAGFQWKDHVRSPMIPPFGLIFVVGSILVYIIVRFHPLKPRAQSAISQTFVQLATFASFHFCSLFRFGMQDVDNDSILSIPDQVRSKLERLWRRLRSLFNYPLPALPQPPPRTVYLVHSSSLAVEWLLFCGSCQLILLFSGLDRCKRF
jgi:hypothetical protein